jgi:hypothetical protein
MFWVGVVLVAVGPIIGKIMQKMGLGSAPAEDRASNRA